MRASVALAALLGIVAIVVLGPAHQAYVLAAALTVLSWTFVVLYAGRSRWRSTLAGKAMMSTSAALALLGAQILSEHHLGEYSIRGDLQDTAILLLGLTILYRILVLRQIQGCERMDGETR
ncbi:putative phage holin [Rhodococcus marinonascens]|uniref:putative phage holin n=1 Tax=Rhodococcus marinonascens TaxID=38311 RepID=UPI000AE34735|nr:hypothetical protein [Rhodococcus marinonascens]